MNSGGSSTSHTNLHATGQWAEVRSWALAPATQSEQATLDAGKARTGHPRVGCNPSKARPAGFPREHGGRSLAPTYFPLICVLQIHVRKNADGAAVPGDGIHCYLLSLLKGEPTLTRF